MSRKFNFTSEGRIEQLAKIRLKPNSESKVNWGVRAYNEWRDARLESYQYDPAIYFSDLRNLETLEKQNFSYALCRFVPEVTKQKGMGPYPGRTLHQMVVAIQKYLNVNKILWNLVDGKSKEFIDVHTVLDNVMKERTAQNVGVTKKQAAIVTYEMEQKLWKEGILGENSPQKLRNTVLFLLGINLMLRVVDEHYHLRREMPTECSQLQFRKSSEGIRCLVYQEDCVSKTHDGGISDRKSDRKEVWIYPHINPERCTIRLVEKYLSLCPPYYVKNNFYLQCLQKPTPKQWYGQQVIGVHTISKVVVQLMKEAKIEGFFTNHSLRRSGGTRLFRAGIDRKLVKEATGHLSDAVDKYQITGDGQRKQISSVLQGLHVEGTENKTAKCTQVEQKHEENGQKSDKVTTTQCNCNKLNSTNVAEIVSELLGKLNNKGKTVIKLEIEVHNE